MDTRLVGYWSDKNLYPGGMKAADIAFRPDGNGWAEGYNAAFGFVILRFTWHAAERRQLTLHLREKVSGTWHREGHTYRYLVTSQNACDTKIVLAYNIRRGRDVLGRPATLLEAGQPISPGVIGDRFAFERELARHERDPAVRRSGRPLKACLEADAPADGRTASEDAGCKGPVTRQGRVVTEVT